MPDKSLTDKYGHLSPQDLRNWLRHEIDDSAKAHELRIKEATEFVTAYALGELNADQALERLLRYEERWGEALFGTRAFEHSTNEQIVQAIDKAQAAAGFRERFGGSKEGPGGTSR